MCARREINVFANRVEIINAGKLPPTISIKDIRHAQFSRNEVIASTLKDLDYLEEYGKGIDLVLERVADWNLLEPIFKNPSNVFKVTIMSLPKKSLSGRQLQIWQFVNANDNTSAKDIENEFSISRTAVHRDLNKLIKSNLISKAGSAKDTTYEPKY